MNVAKRVSKWSGLGGLVGLLGSVVLLLAGAGSAAGLVVVVGLACAAVFFWLQPILRSYAFTVWVFTFVAASMVYPGAFGTWAGFDLTHLIVPLVQIITFGMGTTLSVQDFTRVLLMPWPVFIGLVLQFSVMPLAGYTIAMTFGLPPEVAAGVILIGSVSGGVASNLITYLAGGNVALSVTMTACSTLMSPVMTPTLMKLLAGRLVPIGFFAMVLEILNMVIVPVVAGLIANRILYGKDARLNRVSAMATLALLGFGLAVAVGVLPGTWLGALAALKPGLLLGFGLVGMVALAQLVVRLWLGGAQNWMDKVLPLVSMAGICLIIAIITARSREKLLTVGLVLIAAAVLHNSIGYLLGYWLARAVRLDEISCRTIAIEVGMQNGGMASGLAMSVLKSADAALAPAIFGPWMNVSGSILAGWWRRKPVVTTGKI
jgi:BASS family bile acid:Na+ symporter